ncbi:MAG: hypothetical protein GX149_01755 [Acholeplasmataceae bacterium]|jgi:protein-tyrosine phosphatase|nr:hypothetical protein [Acholeplasmataceae bacterium]
MDEKPKLIDIHTHIIPHVDDGASSFAESLEMLEIMIRDGITDVILTPHVHSGATIAGREEQILQYRILQQKAKDLDIKLYFGSELRYHQNLVIDYEANLMANSNYLLIEFSWNTKTDVHSILQALINRGYKPIVAHAERYSYLTMADYFKLKKAGSLIQVNAGAILGNERSSWQQVATSLMAEKLVDFIASDTHNTTTRYPNLKQAYDYLKPSLSKKYLTDIFYNNALKIIKTDKTTI